MGKKAIIPSGMEPLYRDWRMSPGLECSGFVFLTGFNGIRLDGTLSADPSEQIWDAFIQVQMVLQEGGLTFGDVVEVTSYHVGLRHHLEQFKSIWAQFVREPYPAWTAIEVAGFASDSVVIELRVVAHRSG
ncbi:Rid family hydrolase [Mesorhizobium humile]|uniref:Rid family hydrolase n=1 Tax=Mesorhizobium humile TaxID=3072313 RepID=A0ABU4YHS3_9HYPH|nr:MULTISPECIES: Rid family hydrolase [unclassified Mesorhizobium]MDX8460008.1 Rid family hydrolase [Mesorhizobium sp. VK2D]MDX8486497.1 Rid family hydrolase [Mesorhizobium sp. VK2B]